MSLSVAGDSPGGVIRLGTSLPASAKMPLFDLDVATWGDTIHVTVMIIGDESLIHDFDPLQLNGLCPIFPADRVDEHGRPVSALADKTEVPLNRVAPGTYQGSSTLDSGR